MDCHSPGQGLMPASFKVRTVPLEGDDSATEEVLDPDFGEAAIGRVAPVDSGKLIFLLIGCSFASRSITLLLPQVCGGSYYYGPMGNAQGTCRFRKGLMYKLESK